MMAATRLVGCARANGSSSNFRFSRNWIVLSLGAVSSSVAAATAWPYASPIHQRLMLATTSRPSTGVPSWNTRPSRSVISHSFPSSDTVWPSSICGCGTPSASSANSVSNTIITWLRVTKAATIGSSSARSA
jgi:hypothetical protein